MNSLLPHPRTGRYRQRGGFTLVEVIVVMVVVTLLLTAATPAIHGMLKSSRLTTAGDALLGRMIEAQQMAVTEDTDVEVRFVETTDHTVPGSQERLRTVELLAFRPPAIGDAEDKDLVKTGVRLNLETGLALSQKDKFTSLAKLDYKEGEADEDGEKERYLAFRFRSDGSTDLAPGDLWFLTLMEESSVDFDEVPPNFYTITLDPITGRLRPMRP